MRLSDCIDRSSGWRRAVAIVTRGCRERPRLFAKHGVLPLAGLRLFYSAGDPTRRAASLTIARLSLKWIGARRQA